MPQSVDIDQVLKGSVSEVTIDALSKKGFKQVKVLNQGTVMRLIGEAVDRVLTDRSKEISHDEREKVIKESRSQFEVLARKRLEKERSKIEELENLNRSLAAELETLKKRASASIAVQAERDQAVAGLKVAEAEAVRMRQECSELQERLARKGAEVSGLQAEIGAKTGEIQRFNSFAEAALADLREKTSKAEGEEEKVRRSLLESQKRTAELEGLLAARNAEIEQAAAAPASEPMMQLLSMLSERLQKVSEQSGVGDIKLALDGLSRKLAGVKFGGAGGGVDSGVDGVSLESFFSKETGESVESNIAKVKVKQTKAGAVKGALAKLKEMQKGGEDGE